MASVILGIDPGSRVLGYSVLKNENGILNVLRCDVLRMAHMENHSLRLQYIFDQINQIIKEFQPESVAIETPVFGKDPLAMLKLGRAQAACMLAVTSNHLPVFEYYPKVVKKSITGRGNSNKEQVAFMLSKMVRLPEKKLPKDATDALAIAWCHMMKKSTNEAGIPVSKGRQHQNHKISSWEEFIRNNPDRIR